MRLRFLRGSCEFRAKKPRQSIRCRFFVVYQPPFRSACGVSDLLRLNDLKRNSLRRFAGDDSFCGGFSGDSAEMAHA